MDESTANILFIHKKLSADAFNGEMVTLTNIINITIANTDVSREKTLN